MAFTEEYLPYSRMKYFRFFADGLNASLDEDFTPTFAYEIKSVSLHLSVAHVSVVDFIVRMSAAQGSAYNLKLISQAMSDVQDFIWVPDSTQIFNVGNHLNFSMTMSSNNRYGLIVEGWAVTN